MTATAMNKTLSQSPQKDKNMAIRSLFIPVLAVVAVMSCCLPAGAQTQNPNEVASRLNSNDKIKKVLSRQNIVSGPFTINTFGLETDKTYWHLRTLPDLESILKEKGFRLTGTGEVKDYYEYDHKLYDAQTWTYSHDGTEICIIGMSFSHYIMGLEINFKNMEMVKTLLDSMTEYGFEEFDYVKGYREYGCEGVRGIFRIRGTRVIYDLNGNNDKYVFYQLFGPEGEQ